MRVCCLPGRGRYLCDTWMAGTDVGRWVSTRAASRQLTPVTVEYQ